MGSPKPSAPSLYLCSSQGSENFEASARNQGQVWRQTPPGVQEWSMKKQKDIAIGNREAELEKGRCSYPSTSGVEHFETCATSQGLLTTNWVPQAQEMEWLMKKQEDIRKREEELEKKEKELKEKERIERRNEGSSSQGGENFEGSAKNQGQVWCQKSPEFQEWLMKKQKDIRNREAELEKEKFFYPNTGDVEHFETSQGLLTTNNDWPQIPQEMEWLTKKQEDIRKREEELEKKEKILKEKERIERRNEARLYRLQRSVEAYEYRLKREEEERHRDDWRRKEWKRKADEARMLARIQEERERVREEMNVKRHRRK